MSEQKPVNLMEAVRKGLENMVQPPATPQEPESPYKPCPFCGGQAKKIAVEEASNVGGYVVTCCSCDASSAVVFPVNDSPDGHLDVLWNRRASTPSPEGQTWQPIETAPKDGTRVLLFHHLWQAASTGQFYGSRQGWKLDSTLPPFTMQPIRWRHLHAREDIPFLLKQWDDRESALRALVAQWKQEAVDGLTAGEPDAFERAQVWAECSEELERLLSGPQP